MAVSDTLSERGSRYGEFTTHAKYTQAMKRVAQSSPNWAIMDDDQREALEMVFHKVGRILNGDPNYSDSWHDIAGYAQLVDTRLSGPTSVTVPAGVITPDAMAAFKTPARAGDVNLLPHPALNPAKAVEVPALPSTGVPAPAPFRPVAPAPAPSTASGLVPPPAIGVGLVKPTEPEKSGE